MATKKTAKPVKKTTAKKRAVLVGNSSYGLYIGLTSETDVNIAKRGFVVLDECRHVARWHGKTGGITSLAAHGPCGPQVKESRVGAPCKALLTHIVNVFYLTPEAIAAFVEIVPE